MSRDKIIRNFQLHERAAKQVRRGAVRLEQEMFQRRSRLPQPGTWIRLSDMRNRYLALGIADREKKPFCRVVRFTGGREGPPEQDYFLERVSEARRSREALLQDPSTNVFRLINAEGDGVPGLIIDGYNDFGVAWRMTPGLRAITSLVYPAVMDQFGLKGIYEKGPPREGFRPGEDELDRPWRGEAAPEALIVKEAGVRLEARLNEGPRTGIYPDQRENRTLLAPIVLNRRVLNTFSYTGAFSVSATLAGAAETVSVDLSRRVLDWSKRNFTHNHIDLDAHLHVKADVFDYMNLARRKGLSFGVIILDPPTFSTSGRETFRAAHDWPRLLASSLEILEPYGRIAISCNTRHLEELQMRRFVKEATGKKRRASKVEEVAGLPPDFPLHPQLPSMNYLKFMVVYCE
jgi:23S rRNA (cytosine1962-C5)-methyltransferase